MSKLNNSSTTKRIKSTTWLDRICLCDKSEKESCDESQPMIVQDGELKNISTQDIRTYLPCNYIFCKCCCNHWSKDTGLDSDSEMVMSECLALNNRHLQIDLSDSSISEKWKKEEDGRKRRSLETPSQYRRCASTPIIPKSLTSPSSDLKEAFEKWYHSHFAHQHDSVEVRNQKSIPTASYSKSLRNCSPTEKMCRFVSSKCSYDEAETHYQYLDSGTDIENDVPDEEGVNEKPLTCAIKCDNEEVFSYEDDTKSVPIKSEERGKVCSPRPDHPVESNESSDRTFDNRRRTRKRGAKHGRRPTRNAVLSFLRSLSRRRFRSCRREDDDRVLNIASRNNRALSVQSEKMCGSSSEDSIPNCARNRCNVKHKQSVKRKKNSKNLSKSVPTLNVVNQHHAAKYHSDIIVDEENESKNMDAIENHYAGGDNTENKISFCRDKEMKDVSTNCNETYFVDESVQCNMSDDAKRCTKKENIFHPLLESKKKSEVRSKESYNLYEETKTSSNEKEPTQADSVIAVETNGVEGPHYFIPQPSGSKSEGSFFIRFDPAIHEICKVKDDTKRHKHLRETESCFNLKNTVEKSKVSVLYTQLNMQSDTESQSEDELTELLKDVSTEKIRDKTYTLTQKSEQSGFTKPSTTISSPRERQSYGASESHSALADTTTEEQLLSKNNSKKKHKLLWRLSSIFKKRRSRSRDLTEKGLPQIPCSPAAPAVTTAAVVRERNRHSSPGSRVSGSRSNSTSGGGRMAVGNCRERLSVARHPAAVATIRHRLPTTASASASKRIVATGPHPRPLPAKIRGKRIVTKHRNPTLPFLILDSDDEYERQVALREMAAERRSRYRMSLQSPRREGYGDDLYCPWREFQTWR